MTLHYIIIICVLVGFVIMIMNLRDIENVASEVEANLQIGSNLNSDGVLIVPGLGTLDRLSIVKENLDYLMSDRLFKEKWKCVVYIFASDINPYKTTLEVYGCKIVHAPGQLVAANLKMTTPRDILSHKYVFILLDDVKLVAPTVIKREHKFDFSKFIHIMEKNHLTIASPRVHGALMPSKSGRARYRAILTDPPIRGEKNTGCVATFVEMFAYIMTTEAYGAFWDLIIPEVNPYGWGIDAWYDDYAKSRVNGHKMGVINIFTILHGKATNKPLRSAALAQQRVDQTDKKIKLAAMLEEEKYFKTQYNVTLTSFEELDRGYIKPSWWKNYPRSCKVFLT